NYYRIKRTAMDGSVTYSNTISVNLQVTAVTPVNIPVNDIAIAPVPVARGTVLNVATGISGKISYRILGLNGQTMASGSFYTNTNLNIDRLSPGTYLIQFTAQKQNITKRILVE
uniref:T9SS type A sorting domain-containing protein n=1 Tax=Stenotrophomonas maltophilia TaxID=40324 RepID=UPI00195402AE